MAMASKIFSRPDEMLIARKLTDGCIWAYKAMPSGIMPETFHATICESIAECPWDEKVLLIVLFDAFRASADV